MISIKTNKINAAGIIGLCTVLIVFLVYVFVINSDPASETGYLQSDQGRITLPRIDDITPERLPEMVAQRQYGVYAEYDPSFLSALPPQSKVILFFWSTQCSSCQDAHVSIAADIESIPESVYIFRVEYGQAINERREFGVRNTHTFVELDSLGNFKQRWTGSRSLDAILARL